MNTTSQLVKQLLRARSFNQPLSLESALALTPESEAEAYQVQIDVASELGWFDSNYGPQLWKLGGEIGHSTAAALDISVLKYHSEIKPLVLYVDEACTFTGLEIELAVKLKKPLKAGDGLSDAISAIGKTYLALEVCDERAEHWEALPDLFRLADHQMNRSIVLFGTPLTGWSDTLNHITPVIHLGEELINKNTLTHPQGHPLQALPWLANLSQTLYQQPLQAGTIIATGTWIGMQVISESKPFSASVKGFSKIEVLLAAKGNTINIF